jgi:hypothetical protein
MIRKAATTAVLTVVATLVPAAWALAATGDPSQWGVL